MAALAQAMIAAHDARGALMVGKLGEPRGFALDEAAYPVFGIPAFEAASNSAGTPLVYAIARQESAFQADAVSSAGARGLMQMIASTAARTAKRVGDPFDVGRLTSDPAFNARLGAAHLGDLLAENNGSMILTFAAYNAGGKRVKEWIAAYGDPRKPDVDPIDWVERIPFTETRNYVQRVAENLEMYRLRFGGGARVVGTDLRTVATR
jgi:soluble lytic murein transglycosylase